jgi:uncharacterized protein
MDDVYRKGLLLDFYGHLITKRQYEILDMYFNNDYSLSEISDYLGISRQGVYDNIKKGRSMLDNFENKLGMIKKHIMRKQLADKIINDINTMFKNETDTENRHKTEVLIKNIKELVDL